MPEKAIIKVPIERRDKKVKRVSVSLPCAVADENREPGEGMTFDFSRTGMCAYVNRPIEVGHTLEIQCRELWDKPQKGIVRWCSRIRHNFYRVGVEFK